MSQVKFAGWMAILVFAARMAAAEAIAQGDVTVRVLTVARLHEVQLTAVGAEATVRSCATCAARPAPGVLTATAVGAEVSTGATLGSQRAKEIFADGSFRLVAAQHAPLLVSGKLHITAKADQLLVRLTLPMERYVVAVLNGETAPDEPLESLKAMAVVARTYALTNHTRHQAEGFDLCDDTHCQVARFSAARPLVEQAVSETTGETLWYQGTRAQVFFHQNCGGMTANVRDVFPGNPAAALPYLRAHRDVYCVRRSSAEWQSEVRVADLRDALLRAGIRADFGAGTLAVAARTDAGRARTLSAGGVEIPANTFRIAVNRTLGWNTIKSDWYEIENRGDIIGFHGRGSGHGVGLCQTGAAEMAREGHSYIEILGEYFPGTNIGITASDRGWMTQEVFPFAVSATNEEELVRGRDFSLGPWTSALERLPQKTNLLDSGITVRVFPSTELFRQTTGQPGWVAASTQGKIISMQPVSVLEEKHLFAAVVEHEFLHVLVENESTAATPLWLREGLVEALGEQPGHATSAAWALAKLDQQLSHPTSQASSSEAHAQAGLRVGEYLRRYGLAAVREWLRSGVPADVVARGNGGDRPAATPDAHASHAQRN